MSPHCTQVWLCVYVRSVWLCICSVCGYMYVVCVWLRVTVCCVCSPQPSHHTAILAPSTVIRVHNLHNRPISQDLRARMRARKCVRARERVCW